MATPTSTTMLVLGTAAVAVAGLAVYRSMSEVPACFDTAVAGGAIGGPFELIDTASRTVTDGDVITEPTIIYFGYSFCPDVCPIDNARNAAAVDILADDGYSVTPIFVSIDPERDTPDVMADYVMNFHPRMVGLTGSAEQVKAAANAYRVVYSKADDDPEYYLMSHSVFSYFVHPEDGFVTFFRREDSPEKMAEQVSCYLDNRPGG